MLHFDAARMIGAFVNLENARTLLVASNEIGNRSEVDLSRSGIQANMTDVLQQLERLPVSSSLKAQGMRLVAAVHDDPSIVNVRISEFYHSFDIEIKEPLYVWVPASERDLILAPEEFWTREVFDRYLDAQQDLRGCAHAIALGLWTASVFHAMCGVQHALHRLADRLKVKFSREIDVLNWNEILQGIEKALRELAQQPKTAARDTELQLCASASSHLFAIKEAWRNYVMHGRSTYEERDARTIATNVRAIMQVPL